MPSLVKTTIHIGFTLFAAIAAFTADVTIAHAQSTSCSQLESTLRTFDRNRDFRELERNTRIGQQLAMEVQDAESDYVRGGCQAQQQSGQQLSRQCRNLARQIIGGRADLDATDNRVETGISVSQQREAVLQEIARFGCGTGSRVTIRGNQDGEFRQPRRSMFDQLFGPQDGGGMNEDIIGDEFSGYGGYSTVRTVCVRLSDGYFWPVSYSTLVEYAPNDAQQCYAQCPGTEVDLYYYDNPGQEPENMVNLSGQPYIGLPNAFRYRTEIDSTSSCKPKQNLGSISIAEAQNGQSRAVIAFGELSFPLPLRDPRRQASIQTIAVAEAPSVSVPLPRRRAAAPGEPVPVKQVATPADSHLRVTTFGDKRVRIVGPDTPYARPAGAET
jgi:hypothetical protein